MNDKLKTKNYQGIIFDLDGTLVDTLDDLTDDGTLQNKKKGYL